jgi:SAM-dependent methyltransferase
MGSSMNSSEIRQNRLYGDLAYLWPLLSPPGDYAEEARYWREALREKLGPGPHRLLELGSGGGHNLHHLTDLGAITAVDLSEEMLAHSQRLNPSVEHLVGDMRSLRLGRTFDAVLIHDAISYMLTEDDLRATFATVAAHLRPGGIFITAPDCYLDSFQGPTVSSETQRQGERELTYTEYCYDPDPGDTTGETIYSYYLWEGGALRVELDRHRFGLFPQKTWMRSMEEAGFSVERRPYPVQEEGSPELFLWVCTLR